MEPKAAQAVVTDVVVGSTTGVGSSGHSALTVKSTPSAPSALIERTDSSPSPRPDRIRPPVMYPVVEVFGVTVQGEGRWVGTPTHFVRFGGCDYRCGHAKDESGKFATEPTHAFVCDSLYAVIPEQVRANAVFMNPELICAALAALPGDPGKVVLSGGNPALLPLAPLITDLHNRGYQVAMETQGSRCRSWLDDLDLLTVSPKPPSSGMETDWEVLDRVVANRTCPIDLKIVIFDEADLSYAKDVFRRYPEQGDQLRHFLSLGTYVGQSSRDRKSVV